MTHNQLSATAWPIGRHWTTLWGLIEEIKHETLQYSIVVEHTPFSHVEPKYRYILLRWNRDPADRHATTKEFICEHTDIEQMINVLQILLSVEKEKAKERRIK